MVELKHVSLFFGSQPLFRDLSLEVPDGGRLLIRGASGSGKTSLLRMIFGFRRPGRGMVILDGTPLNISWVVLMILFASFSAIHNSNLDFRLFLLPGMMTGQILGGASPGTAIKYQIAIMLAIFTAVTLSVSLAIFLTSRKSFDGYGVLKEEVFRK